LVAGIQLDATGGGGRTAATFTAEEEERMRMLARDPKIYEKLWSSIAPQISGEYTIDLKKALACLLVGGSRKVLPDGVRVRGDIHVLLMGDPSTAKSQLLKFIENVAPVGVYTSGKGSSAAGLTASVIKDAKGDFFLEGGAMVLADGGVICIDEFDKV
jgi:DNA replication licensing factor MCM5